jgi:hypothetical protein
MALELTEGLRPIGAPEAKKIGMIDDVLGRDVEEFRENVVLYIEVRRRWP